MLPVRVGPGARRKGEEMADCFYHTGRPAVVRCKQCGRPICTHCRHITEHGIFCSDDCAAKGAVFAKRVQELDAKRSKPNRWAPLVRIVILIVALIVLYIVAKRFLLQP